MMPCQRCGPYDSTGNLRRGLKRRGKTEYDQTTFLEKRRYRCQDCGVDVTLNVTRDGKHWDEYSDQAAVDEAAKVSLYTRLKQPQ